MYFKHKKIYLVLTFFCTLGFLTTVYSGFSHANESLFKTNYEIEYELFESGEATVKQNISILNRQKDVVATDYSLTVKKMKIYDVDASSDRERLEPKVEEKNDETTISLGFDDVVIGEGRENLFTVSYKTNDIATKIGEVWNINIPKVSLLDTTERYDVKVLVPKSLGPQIYISPTPLKEEETPTHYVLLFNRELLSNKGISASFGNFQTLNFNLKYDLENTTHFDQTKEITLPPDIVNIQQIVYRSIDPTPNKIYIDPDDNVIAEYTVPAKESMNISVLGTARILGNRINPEFGGKMADLPNNLVRNYTSPTKFWNSDNEAISKIAEELYNPENTVSQNAQAAYFFVTTKLSYDFDILDKEYVERHGSLGALIKENNIGCMEFTDLYIAILRSMGIPARELNGFAIATDETINPLSISAQNGDILHAWAEYYDPVYGWLPVDPTWGSTSGLDYFTKLDTNHLVFVIKGFDPESPLPAGSYKTENSERQIFVNFAEDINESDFEPKVSYYLSTTLNPLRILTKEQRYFVKNEGNTVIYIGKDINTAHKLLPNDIYGSYIKDDRKVVLDIKDATKKEYIITPELKTNNEEAGVPIYSEILELLLLVTSLCVTLGFLVILSMVLKKALHHLTLRPRDQDQ